MKEKSDINKILEGRCQKLGVDYEGLKKANESHSSGTASEIYDPVADRIVDTLSMGETYFFWLKRFEDNVDEILEQMVMIPDIVARVVIKYGLNMPKHFLSTDFVIRYSDGTLKAYSIKPCRDDFERYKCKNEKIWRRNIRRQYLEKKYWEELGVEWELVFSEELNYKKAVNISSIMEFYNADDVSTPDHMYRYLIAHKHILVDMEEYIPFASIANKYKEEIRKLYEEVTNDKKSGFYQTRENSQLSGETIPHLIGESGNSSVNRSWNKQISL